MKQFDVNFLWKFAEHLHSLYCLPHTDPRYKAATFAYMYNSKYRDYLTIHRITPEERVGYETPVIPCEFRDGGYRFVFIAHSTFNSHNRLKESVIRPLVKDEIWFRDPTPYRKMETSEHLLESLEDWNPPASTIVLLADRRRCG